MKKIAKLGYTFPIVRDIAKDIKPAGWIVVANKNKLSFIEIALGQNGPARVEKQLVLDQSLNIEAYIFEQKMRPGQIPINTNNIKCMKDLCACLKEFSSYGTCVGNKNFKRIDKNGVVSVTDYWKHANCELVFKKSLHRPENCCNACVQLNSYLPKKINNTYLSLNQPEPIFSPILYESESFSNSKSNKFEGHKQGKRKKLDTQETSKKIKQELGEESTIEELFINVKEEPLF